MKAIYILAIVCAALFIGLLVSIRSCNANKHAATEAKEFMTAYLDTARITRNPDSSTTVTIQSLEGDEKAISSLNKSSDSTVRSLVKQVERFKGEAVAAAVLNAELVLKQKQLTGVVTGRDTVLINNRIFVYPQYETNLNNKWYNAYIVANKDTTTMDLKMDLGDISFVVGRQKGKAYGQGHIENPYVAVQDFRTYNVRLPKEKRFGVGAYGGYGGTVDTRDGTVIFGPQVGIGVTYHIFEW